MKEIARTAVVVLLAIKFTGYNWRSKRLVTLLSLIRQTWVKKCRIEVEAEVDVLVVTTVVSIIEQDWYYSDLQAFGERTLTH